MCGSAVAVLCLPALRVIWGGEGCKEEFVLTAY